MSSLLELSVAQMSSAVQTGELCAEQLVQASLDAIQAESELGAFLTVTAEAALEAARAIDMRRRRGERLGELAGVPLAVKDVLCTRGVATTCASHILTRAESGKCSPSPQRGYKPPYDATVIERIHAADAVIVGKTNLDEFAMGSSTENSGFGPTRTGSGMLHVRAPSPDSATWNSPSITWRLANPNAPWTQSAC